MTTFVYKIIIDESEFIMIEAELKIMIELRVVRRNYS